MSVFSIELPDKRILDIEAGSEAVALKGAQEWFSQNQTKPIEATSEDVAGQFLKGIPIAGAYVDQAGAALQAAAQPITGAGIEAPTWGERYGKNLEAKQTRSAQYEKENPAFTTGTQVLGGIAATLPVAATAIGARALGLTGKTLPGMVAKGTLSGGTIGGIDALARGHDPLTGTAIGGTVGAAAPIVGSAIGGTVGAISRLANRATIAPETKASQKVLEALKREGLETPQDVSGRLAQLGPEGMLADVGPNLTQQAGAIASSPGAAQKIVRSAIETRSAGARDRIEEAVTEALGPRIDLATLTREGTAARKQAADPLYERFRSVEIFPTRAIKAITPILEKDGLFATARHLMRLEGKEVGDDFFTTGVRKNYPTAEAWDYVKQAMDGKIGEAIRAGNNNVARIYGNLKTRLIKSIDNHPDPNVAGLWKEAREAFATPTGIMKAREEGLEIWKRNSRVGDLKYLLSEYSGAERTAYKQGARDALSELMDASVRGDQQARTMLLAPANQAKLFWLTSRRGYSPQKLTQALEAEGVFVGTKQRVTQNSETAARIAGREDLFPPDASNRLGAAYVFGGMRGIARNAALRAAGKVWDTLRSGDFAKFESEMAKLLTMKGVDRDKAVSEIMKETLKIDPSGGLYKRVRNVATTLIRAPQPALTN